MIAVQPTFPGYEAHLRRAVPLIADIQREVAEYFRIPLREMTSNRRTRDITIPRQVAMYLARQLTPKSFPDIGRRFGNRDHSTIMHAVALIERLIGTDELMAEAVMELEGRL